MIEHTALYLFTLILLLIVVVGGEKISQHKIFKIIPSVVILYALAMALAQSGLWQNSDAIHSSYKEIKTILLPAMLFVMLLEIDFRAFIGLGKSLIIAYIAAVLSLSLSFIAVFWLFSLNRDAAGVFAVLAGSWTGGTANMLAVAAALNVNETLMGYALIVDSINYTLWVMTLLFLVPFAHLFNQWTEAKPLFLKKSTPSKSASKKTNYLHLFALFGFSLIIAKFSNTLAGHLDGLSPTTWSVLIATLLGILASRTPLKNIVSSQTLAHLMLMFLITLIGSQAHLEGFSQVPLYFVVGLLILLLHALLMVLVAKLFKLDLFSIGVASLANIGGIASAPILAAAYDRSLIGIAVLMAIMGYMVGTFVGLGIGYILQGMAL